MTKQTLQEYYLNRYMLSYDKVDKIRQDFSSAMGDLDYFELSTDLERNKRNLIAMALNDLCMMMAHRANKGLNK